LSYKQKVGAIKILYFHPTIVFGGAERATTNLLKCLNRDTFCVTLFTKKGVFNDISADNILYIDDMGISDGFHGISILIKDVRTMLRLIRKERPDVVFGMLHYGCMVLSWVKFLLRGRTKIIVSPRTPSRDAIDFYFKDDQKKRLLWNFLVYFFCRYSDHIIVPCFGMRNECQDIYKADSNKVTTIRNSIDIEKIKKLADVSFSERKPEDSFIISTGGRLASEKKLPVLLQAFVLLKKKIKCKLWIIGDGPEKPFLEALVKKLQVENDIVFWGFQENPYRIIKNSDVFVHTSIFEGFANMIWEVMACGVPVISTDCNYGPREIIRNMENGILVPVSDEVALMEALRLLLGDASLRKRFAENAYTEIANLNGNKMAREYENVFLTLNVAETERQIC
jgi:glycosyltransferase involved in cell wall biosynthesis